MKNFTQEFLQKQWSYPKHWMAGFIMLFVLLGTNAFAQTATLGTGTAVSVANSGSGLGPVNSYYANMRYQVVYTAAEITAAGGAAGLVSQFGWNVSTPSAVVLPDYKIRMAQTTATNSAAHDATALTEVYNSSYTSTAGYNMFTLTTPFVWDGTSNILVDICYGPAAYTSPYGQVFVYGTEANSSRFARSDGSSRCASTTDQINAFKPQARFVFAAVPACLQPTGLTASAVTTTTTGSVSWTASSSTPANGYDYYYSATNTAPTAATTPSGTVTGTTVSLTALPAFTTQYVWVRSNCGNDGASSWNGPVSFTTLQVPATVPYNEDFEGTPQWVLLNGSQANKWFVGTATNNGGTQALYISSNNGVANTYVNTTSVVQAYRDITLPADIVQAKLSFDYRGVGESTYDYVKVWVVPTTFIPTPGTSITTTNSNGGVLVAEYVNLRSTYQNLSYIVPASAYAGQTVRLVFEWINDGSGGTIPPAAIDNVNVSVVTCIAPTAVTAGVTPGNVNVSWTAPATAPAGGYDYYYSTTNTAPTAETTPIGNVATGTSIALTTLSTDTVYYVWVRSHCADGDTSVWTSVVSFRTDCTPATPSAAYETFATYDGSAASPACWREATGALATIPAAAITYGNSSWENQNYNNATNANGRAAYVELYATRNAWIISPAINLGTGTTSYQLEYSASVIPWSGATPVAAMGEKYVKVVVSRDGGLTWSDANVLRTYNNANIPASGVNETIQLTGYTGTVKIGFYAYSTTTDQDLRFYIDNFRVREVPNCLNPITPVLGTVGETTAQVSWTAPATAPANGYEYYVGTTTTAPTAATAATGTAAAGIVTATASALTPSTQYYIWVRSNCGDSYSEWVGPVSVMTLCDAPDILTTTPGTVCGIGTATLSATTSGGTINWYTAATGGTAVGTGANFVTPSISETTTYYVTAGATGIATSGGALAAPTTAATGSTLTNAGLVFNAASDFTLNSVDVFLNSATAGNVVVALQNSAGTQLQTATIAVPAGNATTPVQFTLNLGWVIPQGNGYRILAVSGPSMLRETSTAFPYTVGYSANVTGGYYFGSSTSYFYFYNWNYTGVCYAPRVAVVATVTEAQVVTIASSNAAVCAGQSTTLTATSANEDYTYVWTPGTNLTGAVQTVSPTATTTYTVTATDAVSGCVTTSTITVNVNALPAALTVTPAAPTVCPDTVQALVVTGASAQGPATIGTGTTAPGTTAYPNPFNAYYGGVKTQILVRESELLAQGLVVGAPITSVSFDFAASVAVANNDLRIKVGTTALDAFTTAFVPSADLTTVYNANYTPTAGTTGWVPFAFTTPYIWTGGNIVVEVAFNSGNSGNGSGTRTNTTTTTFNSVYTGARDSTTPAGVASLDALAQTAYAINRAETARPNIAFNFNFTNTVSWAPVTGLYTDEAATVPYTGQNITTVYTKPTENVVYTVTATNDNGCTISTTATITVGNTAAPVAVAAQNVCNAGTVAQLEATGTAVKWYAAATGGAALANDAALVNNTIYYASQTVNGCESVTRTPVTVTISTVTADELADVVLCGGTYVLPALTSGNYFTQSNGAGTQLAAGTPITQTTVVYIFATAANAANCTDETSFTVTITNVEAPVGVSPQTVTAATAAEATIEDIIVTATGTVTWYATESDAIAGTSPLAAGTQLVAGTTYYATQTVGTCTSTEVLAVTIEAILGGKDFDATSFSYYPNPVANELNLTYSAEITSVAVFNLIGQQVISQQPNAAIAKVDTSMLAEGTYLVKVTAGNAVKTFKVIKKN